MKINFLLPHKKIAGGVKILLIYADYLSRFGHKVNVLVPFFSWKEKLFNLFGIQLLPNFIARSNFNLKYIKNFSEENIPAADATIAGNVKTAEGLINYSDRAGEKFFLIQHDEGLYHFRPEEANKVFKYNFKRIVVSTWLKETLKEKYGVDSELILNTLDKNFFKPVDVVRNDSNIRILMLHHKYEWKGAAEGVKIVENLKVKYPNVKLIMFGAREKNIEFNADEYYYRPNQEKLVELYSGCDIFLCPSWDEGFGLPSLEAMACKCAVATYDNGGSRDFAFDGRTAMVAKRRDVDDLKNKLEILISNEVLRKKIAQAGYEFVQTMPTWEEQARKFERILLSSIE